MKNIYLTLLLSLFFTSNILGQDSLYIFKAGLVNTKYSINQVDSITFSNTLDSLKFNKNGLIFNKLSMTNVDSIAFTAPNKKPTYTDIDGNIYTTVKIGTQTWMVENLKTTRFRNGDPIPMVSDNSAWSTTESAAYCDYDNMFTNGLLYGHLYNWYAANDSRNIAPAGWHVPSVDEWSELKEYLIVNGYNFDNSRSGNYIAKSLASRSMWNSSTLVGSPGKNQLLNNSTGFNALPGGYRYGESGLIPGSSSSQSDGSYFWSKTGITDLEAYGANILYGYKHMNSDFGYSMRVGFGIRCLKSDLASLSTEPITSITFSSAISGGNISFDGHDPILTRGLCWDTISNPTIMKNHTTESAGIGSFTSSMKNLLPGKVYYIRAYATNTVGTAYGNERNFKTLSTIPTLSTKDISSITASTATSGGQITSNGGANITARGVCWSINPNPIVKPDSITLDGSGSGTFSSLISNLKPGTKYYIRAYATNSEGTAYGNEHNFETLATIPTLTSKVISLITTSTASSGGEIIANGGANITARGVCWSINPNPVLRPDSITLDGNGSGSFNSLITNLMPGTRYYVRAYATNNVGTAYGNENNFITLSTIPTVSTHNISVITTSTAFSGGDIIADGGENVTARGVCWSINPNPEVKPDSITLDGNGSGTFSSLITNLMPGTRYYVRAYATNSLGTAYGNENNFITLSSIPTLTSKEISSITISSASSGGEIINDGGENVTARGVCWSINPNPEIRPDSITLDGNGSGSFTSLITNLKPGTRYYVRAYATNSEGTAYGNEHNFTTLSTIPTLTTTEITAITATTALCGGVITTNGGETITARGICWSTNQSPTISENKTSDGVGIGLFISTITSLTPSTKYYVRSYATNSVGTAYGNEIAFETLTTIP